MSSLDKLYKKRILDEAKSPYHFEKHPGKDSLKAYNPICGDKYEIYIDGQKLFFHGFGCTISKASTSLMIKSLEGKPRAEALRIIDEFLDMVAGGEKVKLESLLVFENPSDFKGRKDCITLAWKVLRDHLT